MFIPYIAFAYPVFLMHCDFPILVLFIHSYLSINTPVIEQKKKRTIPQIFVQNSVSLCLSLIPIILHRFQSHPIAFYQILSEFHCTSSFPIIFSSYCIKPHRKSSDFIVYHRIFTSLVSPTSRPSPSTPFITVNNLRSPSNLHCNSQC